MRAVLFVANALVAACVVLPARSQTSPPSFAEVEPILRERCIACHAGTSAPLGLRLDSLQALLRGSARGPVVKAGDPAGSPLVQRLRGQALPRMPMTGPPFLEEGQIALIERWIAGGLRAGEPGSAVEAASGAAATPSAAPGVAARAPRPGEPVTYAHVAPIFATRCAHCHTGTGGRMGPPPEGFVLTSYEATLSRADRVRVVPGREKASELVRRIRGQGRPRMPFDGPPYLGDAEVALIERWIAEGARDASGRTAPLPVGAAVRLHGTLDAAGRLDGLPLVLGPGTRIDRNPGPGSYVEVRGRLDDNGAVLVERMRVR